MARVVDTETGVYGIFGNPVRHSLSPLIHNALFEALHINAVYNAYEIEKRSLRMAMEAVRTLGFRGVNLTIPFKEEALNLVDEVPSAADQRLGAINTVVNRSGVLYGHNTDGPGFLKALAAELEFVASGKCVLVLGAGGAARAVLFALASGGAERLWILNRTAERAEGLAQYLAQSFSKVEIKPYTEVQAREKKKIDLVVNATSLGMQGSDPPPFDLGTLDRRTAVYDLVYRPAETPLLKSAKALGMRGVNGLGMLAAQAALSFELWTGRSEGVREKMLGVLRAFEAGKG